MSDFDLCLSVKEDNRCCAVICSVLLLQEDLHYPDDLFAVSMLELRMRLMSYHSGSNRLLICCVLVRVL